MVIPPLLVLGGDARNFFQCICALSLSLLLLLLLLLLLPFISNRNIVFVFLLATTAAATAAAAAAAAAAAFLFLLRATRTHEKQISSCIHTKEHTSFFSISLSFSFFGFALRFFSNYIYTKNFVVARDRSYSRERHT